MINNAPTFYIVIPVYKVEKYIHDCINSVLRQTYQNFNIIAIDDGSPDNSGRICDEYAKKDKRLFVIHQENKGQIAARSKGVEYILSKCNDNDYVIFLDSDDTLCDNALYTIDNTFRCYNCDVVVYNMQKVNNGEVVNASNRKNNYVGVVENKRELYNVVFNDAKYNSLCCKAVSVSILQDIDYSNFYKLRHGEDLLQSLKIYKNCKKVAFIDDVLYNYRYNPTSVTNSVNFNNIEIESTVRHEVYKFLIKENVWTNDDFRLYMQYCGELLSSLIIRVCSFREPFEKKKELLERIYNDTYYAIVLEKAKNNKILRLFKQKKYRLINNIILFMGVLRKIYRKIFKGKN